jgi:predicted transposase/invertase (TIGR01784 family)
MKFADPKNDVAFKKIFGDEKHKEVLISFLNSILDFKDEKTIVDVTLSNTYQLSQIEELKDTILDIKAKNQNGEEFIVEMQKKGGSNFTKRSLYYTSKAYVNQIDKAIDFKKLKKVYYIAIVNFNIFENISFISRHLIINQETIKQDIKDMEFTFVELKKFNLPLSKCDTIVKKWIYFINNASSLELIPKELENIKEFKIAFQTANTYSWNKDELEIYDYILLKEANDIDAIRTAENKGIEKGIVKGIEKGKLEEKINIAKNLLLANVDINLISTTTNLTIKQIEDLKNN